MCVDSLDFPIQIVTMSPRGSYVGGCATDVGNSVQDAVTRINASMARSNAGNPHGVYLRAASQPRSRHGHAVQAIRQRRVSRKRPHGIRSTHASVSRSHPAARRKTRSAEGARVCQRARRQSSAHLAGDFGNVSDKVKIIDNDVVQYKQVIGTVRPSVEL